VASIRRSDPGYIARSQRFRTPVEWNFRWAVGFEVTSIAQQAVVSL
jgi:hypothetical protein